MSGENERRPYRLRPCYHQKLWGGERLIREYGKADAPPSTAESWELAAHPAGASLIADGPLAGKSLEELGAIDRDGFWGESCKTAEFPILVKLIDAKRDLSVQVHPSDTNALAAFGEQGKTEFWYILDCEPRATVYCGFSRRMTQEEFLRRARDGSICESLNRIPVKKGDMFRISPGTIHAIGAGVLLAEVQQNSDTTFRIYDYLRRDRDGLPRPLHLERAASVLNYEPIELSAFRRADASPDAAFSMSEMFACRYFRVYMLDVRTEGQLRCDGSSFQHILCVDGCGELVKDGKVYPFARGGSYFLPAAMGGCTIRGICRVLLSRL